MARIQMLFDGFEDLAYEISKLGDEPLRAAVDEALSETQKLIQRKTAAAAAKYGPKGGKGYATGGMKSAIHADGVEWSGPVASVGVGFDLEGPGYHSIFVMYGTPRHAPNNPGISQDRALYNAIRGTGLNAEIEQIQLKAMQKHLTLGGKQ